jgi:tetratricopeptide (TPR) repeat protein
MKKLMILLAVLLTANVMMAQKKDRTDAFMYNKNGQYEKAMMSIEKCINHEQFHGMKPHDQATAWLYRATIYQNIIQSEDESLKAKAPDALEKVYESLMKCMENKSFMEENRDEIITRVNAVMNSYYNEGANAFDAGNYEAAIPQLKKAYDIAASLGIPESVDMLKYAAFACIKAKEYDKAIEYYELLHSTGYEGEDLYHHLASAYLGKDDKEQAAKAIADGIAKFPNSEGLIRENVNLKLSEGKGTEAVADLEQLLETRPDDVTLMFALGTIYGDDTKDMFDGDKAIDYYTRAINAKPDYYDAIYNLGALYINMSNKIKEQADAITGFSKAEQQQYEELSNQANELIRTGLPYVKQAFEAQPSPEIKSVLKSMYVRLNMLEEAKALEATE